MTSSWFDINSTSKILNTSLLWFNKRYGSENLDIFPFSFLYLVFFPLLETHNFIKTQLILFYILFTFISTLRSLSLSLSLIWLKKSKPPIMDWQSWERLLYWYIKVVHIWPIILIVMYQKIELWKLGYLRERNLYLSDVVFYLATTYLTGRSRI